jgi:PIN domain nuclease of toxin-antitoxin system
MIVLDTHVWIWWVSDPGLVSADARKLMERSIKDESIHISCISSWEVAMLADRGRLQLTMPVEDWVERSEALSYFNFIPVTNSIALKSVCLPAPFHSDPADRIIVATAIAMGATLVTKDKKILGYPYVRTAW